MLLPTNNIVLMRPGFSGKESMATLMANGQAGPAIRPNRQHHRYDVHAPGTITINSAISPPPKQHAAAIAALFLWILLASRRETTIPMPTIAMVVEAASGFSYCSVKYGFA